MFLLLLRIISLTLRFETFISIVLDLSEPFPPKVVALTRNFSLLFLFDFMSIASLVLQSIACVFIMTPLASYNFHLDTLKFAINFFFVPILIPTCYEYNNRITKLSFSPLCSSLLLSMPSADQASTRLTHYPLLPCHFPHTFTSKPFSAKTTYTTTSAINPPTELPSGSQK